MRAGPFTIDLNHQPKTDFRIKQIATVKPERGAAKWSQTLQPIFGNALFSIPQYSFLSAQAELVFVAIFVVGKK